MSNLTTRVDVSLGDRSYPIFVEDGLITRSGEILASFARGGRILVVSDENVWAAQGDKFLDGLARAHVTGVPIVLPPGEATKSWPVLSELIGRLLAEEIERSDHVVALGGGVIGDLVGFAAAIVNRGCGFVQVPTTLLAQVDSSVGGKTAINVPAGKNLVGAFHQPAAVLIDPCCLDTLPLREVRAGYAEVVKYGLINDADFFAWCEVNAEALLNGHSDARHHAILHSVKAKAEIVGEDERETKGARALLNLGHTFGHALEVETGFSDRLLHGEAVAAGMALAYDFSAAKELCSSAEAERMRRHLADAGFRTSLAEIGITADGKRLTEHMLHDKKKSGGRVPFILARGIGQAYVDKSVDLNEVERFLDGCV